jgi:hypothetical protein
MKEQIVTKYEHASEEEKLQVNKVIEDIVDVFDQALMSRMETTLADTTGKPVLSSPRLGVLALKDKLAAMA